MNQKLILIHPGEPTFILFVEDTIGIDNEKAQLFISTHLPFMVSSLKRNNVYQFSRSDHGLIDMKMAQNENLRCVI